MITALLLFIVTAFTVIIYIIYTFRAVALLLLGIVILVIGIKVYREVKQGGFKRTFGAFRNYPTDNEQVNLVKYILDKCNQTQVACINEDVLLSVSNSGIYIVKVLEPVGNISGKKTNPRLLLKNNELLSIPNFFLELDDVEMEIKKYVQNPIIKKIIVKKGSCMIQVPHPQEYLMFGMHNFYYQLQMLEKNRVYTDENLQVIQNCLSNSVKLR